MNSLKRLFFHEEWNIGLIRQSRHSLVREGLLAPVEWLPAPRPWTFRADPFLVQGEDGNLHLFCEAIDLWQGKGEIHHAAFRPETATKDIRLSPLISERSHLSYPFVIQAGPGNWLMIAENWEGGAVPTYRAPVPGGPWERGEDLLTGRLAVDPTLFEANGRWWLATTFQDDGSNSRLHLFHGPSPEGPWTAHALNPVKDDVASARPAGAPFALDGELYRPAQDCTGTYGAALVVQRITALGPDVFEEECIRRLGPVPGRYDKGLHSLSGAGGITAIDGKRWRGHPLEPVRKLVGILKARRRRPV